MNKQKQQQKQEQKQRIKTPGDDNGEKIIKFQLRERDGHSPYAYVYIPLEFRRALGLSKGQKLIIKLNKQKDGFEIRQLKVDLRS